MTIYVYGARAGAAALLIAIGGGEAMSQTVNDAATADAAIAERLMTEARPVQGEKVVLWAQPDALPESEAQAFAVELGKALAAIEGLTGEQFDQLHYGETAIQVFVGRRVTVSHVYGGYAHASFKRPYLYLNPQRVRNRGAPYLHELTHIVLWKFGSHSLREGFASYVEGRLASEGVGYNSGVFGPALRAEVDSAAAAALATDAGQKALPWIGGKGGTDPSITSADSPETRAAFYLLARSYVHHLLDSVDMPTFIKLYRAEETTAAYRELTGRPLEEWRRSWQQSLASAREAS